MDDALEHLKRELDAAPKSTRGFVNWKRNQRLQGEAVQKMVDSGMDQKEARSKAFEVGKPYDTVYSKQ